MGLAATCGWVGVCAFSHPDLAQTLKLIGASYDEEFLLVREVEQQGVGAVMS